MKTAGVSQPTRLLDYVKRLENRDNPGRGKVVESALAGLGIEAKIQRWPFPRVRNIIVDLPPASAPKRLLFSAHYDAVKGCPGANDNASSVAVLLGLCEHFASAIPPLPLRLVFFDREEAWLRTPFVRLGLLGSFCYVARNRISKIRAVINLEYAGEGDVLALWPAQKKQTNLRALIKAEGAASSIKLEFRTAHIPWLLLSSDHLPFRLRGLGNSISLSLLPSDQIPALETMISRLSLFNLLVGRRPLLPPILARIHSAEDVSSHVNEGSLQIMLKLLLRIIREYASGPWDNRPA